MIKISLFIITSLLVISSNNALDNGLSLTPVNITSLAGSSFVNITQAGSLGDKD